jgi:uncharacterized protein YdhG (YjbR/CyaY superfamily)
MSENRVSKIVDDYIENQPEQTKKVLLELRSYILEADPNAIEMLNYNIPAFALVKGGKRQQQMMIAGYKKHVGLYPHPTVMEYFRNELKGYEKGKGSVQFALS